MINSLKKRIWILLMTLGFLCIVTVVYVIDVNNLFSTYTDRVKGNCTFSVEAEGVKKEIKIWYESKEKKFYLFVPSYMELEDTVVDLSDHVTMYLGGKKLKNGSSLSGFEYGKDYEMSFSNIGKESTLQLVETGGVATMYLETESGSMRNLKESKDNTESGYVTFYTEDGNLDYRGRVDRVKGRGNTSWSTTEKKPFSIKLSEKGNILGMGEAKKWILINNYNDVSNLSNKLIYDLADEVGLAYSPDCQLVDAYFNGIYYGVYLLSEKNEIEENRVEVETPTNVKGSSYLIDQDLAVRTEEKDDEFVVTDGGYDFSIVDPDDCSEELKEEIQSDVQSLENALYSEDGIDPVSGKSWDQMIDLDSWVKKYLIEEVFENIDAAKLSQFYYKTGIDGDDKIYAGPVWDYNSSFGNIHSGGPIHNPRCLYASREWIQNNYLHNWYYYLYKQDKFYNRVVEIYRDTYEPLLKKLANEVLPEWQEKIRLSSNANLRRWRTNAEGYGTTSDAEIAAMRQFLNERIEYLHDDWVNGADYCYISALRNPNRRYSTYAVLRGEVLKESDILKPLAPDENSTFAGWYDSETEQPYDFSSPVTRDEISIYAKWE